jgi:hypothetical protein
MIHPIWPKIIGFNSLNTSKRFLAIGVGCLLMTAVVTSSTYMLYDDGLMQSAKAVDPVAKTERKVAQPDTTAEVAPIDESSSTTRSPMNRPGNRYVDENSAGPEKLTYRERKSLIISPSTLTVYTTGGAPMVPNELIRMVYPLFQIDSDDGQITGFPSATNTGGVYFAARTTTISYSPLQVASWPMVGDARFATPGTYTVTFTAWSPDRQIRYTGSMQVIVETAPDSVSTTPS